MKNSFLFSAIFIFISVGLYSQIIKPWFDTALAKNDQIETLRSVFAQGQDLQVKRDTLRSELNAVPSEQQNLIRDAIPEYSPGNVALFLLELDQLVKDRSGLPLDTTYDVGAPLERGTDIVALPVSFNFGEIPYITLRQFVLNLQRWEKGIRIQTVQVGLPADEDLAERGIVRAAISVEVLFSSVPPHRNVL